MNNAKVYIVNSESRADYKVYFVTAAYQEVNADIIKGGQLVSSESQATVKVFIVTADYRATIKITHANFPK
ncbi:MAG: hypothetical protein LBM78_03420 [Clostridiales bacterium]|jgi:hypothetical protein|nr:hypothetical protein [Clostridiales bacterium]